MASRQSLVPRPGRPSATTESIRGNRAPLGASPAAPAAEPAANAASARRAPRTAAAPRTQATAAGRPKGRPASPDSVTRPRPSGTSRVAVDVAADVAEQFRDRARHSPFRFTQAEALTGALQLLAGLDQAAYDELLLSVRQ